METWESKEKVNVPLFKRVERKKILNHEVVKREKMLCPSEFWNQILGYEPLSTEDTLQEDFTIQ